ncbi:MAG: response regulator [Pseudomonadota bacterium]
MNFGSALIVDDNKDDIYILRRMITEAGLANEVFEADDGSTALDFLTDYDRNHCRHPDKFPPILIFLDINMPVMDGFEFLMRFAAMRDQYDYSACSFMVFTSSEHPRDRERTLQYGFVKGYITKMPETPEELREQVERCLSAH